MNRPQIPTARLLILSSLCLASACQMPLVLQDPNAPTGYGSEWSNQGRFRGTAQPAGELYDAGLEQAAQEGERAAATAATGAQAPGGPGGTPGDPLYGWDGGVVPTAEPGDIAASASPSARGLEPSLEGRMHILELYQEVLDERDALRDEVDALRKALASTREHVDGVRATSERDEQRLAELEQSRRALIEENRLLLGRLTTAQVRRLEAEKLLVETQMAWFDERAKQPGASAPVSFISGETQGGDRP